MNIKPSHRPNPKEVKTVYYFSVSDPSRPFIRTATISNGYIPSNATLIPIPSNIPNGYSACWDKSNNEWKVMEDCRGKTIYNKQTTKSMISPYIGLPDDYTLLKPSTSSDSWDYENNCWVTNKEEYLKQQIAKRKEERDELVNTANQQITKAEDCINYLTKNNKSSKEYLDKLNEWVSYREILNTLIFDREDFKFPEEPELINDDLIKKDFPIDPLIEYNKKLEELKSKIFLLECKKNVGTITGEETLELTKLCTEYVKLSSSDKITT